MTTTFDDILQEVNKLQADKVLVDWSGCGGKAKEIWKLQLTNEPEVLLKKLNATVKTSFKMESFQHAEKISEQLSQYFKIPNSFTRPTNISEDNLFLVIEIIYN